MHTAGPSVAAVSPEPRAWAGGRSSVFRMNRQVFQALEQTAHTHV